MISCSAAFLCWYTVFSHAAMHPDDHAPMGHRLTSGAAYNTQPAVQPHPAGGHWIAWVAYTPGKSDHIVIARLRDNLLETPQRLTEGGDLFRPVLVASDTTRLLLFTQTLTKAGPRIFFSLATGDRWSDPQPLPGQTTHTLNPEAAALPDGSIAIVYQVYRDGGYAIALRLFKSSRWSDEKLVCPAQPNGPGPIDSWDPVLAWDADSKKLFIAWVSYFPGDYDLCWATYANGDISLPQRIPQKGYDLHPAALADPKAGVWLTWDSITLSGHAGSGLTFIKHPRTADPNARDGQHKFHVAAAKWENGALAAPSGDVRVSSTAEDTRHGGSPRMCFDASGRLFIAYRTLHQSAPAERNFYWDITTRHLDGNRWSSPLRIDRSDGPTEEAALAADSGGIRVFFQRDHRLVDSPQPRDTTRPSTSQPEHNHHADYGDPKLRHGDIYEALVPVGNAAAPDLRPVASQPAVNRPLTPFEPYKKGPYTVLFGDLHRHSNVSRCLRGVEPDADDHYRYSRDVCRYDFLGVSDHASHSSPYNWWRLQKLADLYYMPGDFTTLFGVEWNGPEGHKNVMSPRRDLPLLAETGDAPNASALWAALDRWGGPAITIPHTPSLPGQDTDWSAHNDKYQRLVEIFQANRGSFEGQGAPRLFHRARLNDRHVQNALTLGYRLGFICSTDHGYGASYACVYARENTRDAVFDALHDRRAYGSTAYGIIVDFNVNDAMMGRVVKRGDSVTVTGYVRGTAKLDRVEVLKNNKVVKDWNPSAAEWRFNWRDPDPGTGHHWYYLRVIQEDDEMAWSSPIWVTE